MPRPRAGSRSSLYAALGLDSSRRSFRSASLWAARAPAQATLSTHPPIVLAIEGLAAASPGLPYT